MNDTTDWRTQAACRGYHPELFYPPEDGSRGDVALISKAAIKVCAGCPVRHPCLEDADEYGVWGGTTQTQRRKAVAKKSASTIPVPRVHLPDAEIASRYNAGESVQDLATAYRVHWQTIADRLNSQGVVRRQPAPTSADTERNAQIVDLYGRECSLSEIAAAVGLSHESVRKRLVRAGVQLRPAGGRARTSNRPA